MKPLLQLLAIGDLDARLLEKLRPKLETKFGVRCQAIPAALDPSFAFHAERQQYHSTEILSQMRKFLRPGCWRLLGVTAKDLYIPILTFVFGEAQLGGECAIVSMHRLRQEFYGLPGDDNLMRDRLVKEAVHEVGHTLELTHCQDYRCAMAASHAVEWIDIKEDGFCPECYGKIFVTPTEADFSF
jgi:archaemetzincin